MIHVKLLCDVFAFISLRAGFCSPSTDQSVGVVFRTVILAKPPHSEQYQNKITRQPHSDCAAAQSCYLRRASDRWAFLHGRMSRKSYSKALNVMSFVTQ